MEDVKTAPGNGAEVKGTFRKALYRKNSKIRDDRADAIARKADIAYKRAVEDLATKIEEAKAELDTLLDLSPTNADSLVLASDFDAAKFIQKDHSLRVTIYNDEKRLELVKAAYEEMFDKPL